MYRIISFFLLFFLFAEVSFALSEERSEKKIQSKKEYFDKEYNEWLKFIVKKPSAEEIKVFKKKQISERKIYLQKYEKLSK